MIPCSSDLVWSINLHRMRKVCCYDRIRLYNEPSCSKWRTVLNMWIGRDNEEDTSNSELSLLILIVNRHNRLVNEISWINALEGNNEFSNQERLCNLVINNWKKRYRYWLWCFLYMSLYCLFCNLLWSLFAINSFQNILNEMVVKEVLELRTTRERLIYSDNGVSLRDTTSIYKWLANTRITIEFVGWFHATSLV